MTVRLPKDKYEVWKKLASDENGNVYDGAFQHLFEEALDQAISDFQAHNGLGARVLEDLKNGDII